MAGVQYDLEVLQNRRSRLSNRILLLLVVCGLVASASAQSGFDRYNFTLGGGLGIGRDDVAAYVGNSPQFVVGAGRNFTRMFGVDAEYMYYDLGFRPSVVVNQSLPVQSGHMQSVSLDGIVSVPRHFGKFGAYGIFGLGFYDRTVSLKHSQILPVGALYQPAWRWWDINWVDNNPAVGPTIQPQQTMSSNSRIAGGFNYGGGLTYRLNYLHNAKVFFEYRYHRAYQADGQTIGVPLTVGLRW
jgi:hypothetical protein